MLVDIEILHLIHLRYLLTVFTVLPVFTYYSILSVFTLLTYGFNVVLLRPLSLVFKRTQNHTVLVQVEGILT